MPNASNIESPILVIGPGRSGTSWLLHALDEHADCRDIIENHIVEGLFFELFENWWCKQWHWVCDDEKEWRARGARAARSVLCEMFPTDQAQWVMKMIWRGKPWQFVREVFPGARFIHITRSPVTAIPSMMDFMGHKNAVWQEIEHAETEWLQSHREAVRLRDQGAPYLRIKQEDALAEPERVWTELLDFCNLARTPMTERVTDEINPAKNMRGKLKLGRPPMEWTMLRRATLEMSRELGYLPSEVDITPEKPIVVDPAIRAQAEQVRLDNKRLHDELGLLRQENDRLQRMVENLTSAIQAEAREPVRA